MAEQRTTTHGEGIEEILARARSGDRAAENELFSRLDARIRALAKRRIWDEEAAEDLAQETLKTVLAKYRDAELPRGLLPWVFTIFHHKVGNWLKRLRVEGRTLERGRDEETVGLAADGRMDAVDLRIDVERALARATPDCRKIFRLLLEGAGRREILDAFPGESTGTVDSRISRCRRRLLQGLQGIGKEGG